MITNLEAKIEQELTELVQAKWETLVKETGTDKLAVPEEYLALVRIFYQLGYQEGQADMFTQVKEIYENDTDHFIEMFGDNEE